MNSPSRVSCCGLLALVLACPALTAEPSPAYGSIEVLRDTWGIPHVFSESDAGALYGLGYATAEDRGFQMTYGLRIIQGRLAETIGNRSRPGRRETALEHDRRMRAFGWARAAARTASNLDADTRHLLEAYCAGVNDSFAAQEAAGRLHPLFEQLGVTPESWTPADCLLSWWHLAQFFAGDGTRDLMMWRNRARPRPGQPTPPQPSRSWLDDAAAVVQREDVSEEWLHRVRDFGVSHGSDATGGGEETPKFSHAWVVGGRKTTTGAAVLVSDPQTPVRNPSLWMEFHLSGRTFNVRGIGVPGSPGLLIGFNRHVAWGLTALGADQADLFRLETSGEHPDAYRWNGQWRPMEIRTESIRVKGGATDLFKIRETHQGPVVSAFCFQEPGEPEVALQRIPICEPERDTIQAVLAMMRARNAAELGRALGGWRFPSANCVYGDAQGHIGYAVLGAIPVRSRQNREHGGGEAMAGSNDADDWQGFIPAELLPQVMDPAAGYLLSANHRAIGAFYPLPLGAGTGSLGDTIRSWRLRERLQQLERFSPTDVLDIHYDDVNPARRELARLGCHLRDTGQGPLSVDALRTLEVLDKWLAAGARSDLNAEGAQLATRLSTFFRFVTTPLASKFGGGESGLARFLKDASARIKADPRASFDRDTCRYMDGVLTQAGTADNGSARGANQRQTIAPRRVGQGQNLGWFDSLDGFGSLDTTGDLRAPALDCVDGQTLRSQASQSYTQWVPLHDPDAARTICPIGHSDRPDSPFRTSTLAAWAEGKLHPAPLNRTAVEAITVRHLTLAKAKSAVEDVPGH